VDAGASVVAGTEVGGGSLCASPAGEEPPGHSAAAPTPAPPSTSRSETAPSRRRRICRRLASRLARSSSTDRVGSLSNGG
jgi:hypothetical protein